MDPITAVSLAGTIISFVDLGLKVFSKAAEIRRSTDGFSSGSSTAQLIAADIVRSMESIRTSQLLAVARGSADSHDYDALLDECAAIAKELLEDLAKIRDGEPRGKFSSPKKAMASIRSEKHVETVLKRLELVRDGVIL